MRHVACQAAPGCPLLTGDPVLMGAGATFGCAVLGARTAAGKIPRTESAA